MKIDDILRLIRKNIGILIITPLFLSVLVSFLTRHPQFTYTSETILYTGIASGSSVEMDKTFNFFATNTAFDNLINIIKSRETQQEVAIRLLAEHLMLPDRDSKYILQKSWEDLHKSRTGSLYKLVVKPGRNGKSFTIRKKIRKQAGNDISSADSLGDKSNIVSSSEGDTVSSKNYLPPVIDQEAYEKTVENLTAYMSSDDTNFVYRLINSKAAHYSINAISSVTVQRISSSDLVKLVYESDDPGICQQTLQIFTEVCIKNYKRIKENRSDAVVKYFENQVHHASDRLKEAEDKLLRFNEDNKIINYYEQSKAVAIAKEELEADYNNKRIKLAGLDAAIKGIEEKLQSQGHIQIRSTSIINKRNELADINTRIITAETMGSGDTVNLHELSRMKGAAEKLKEEIKSGVNDLYLYGHSTEGLPTATLLNDWLANVIDYEDTKAGLQVLGERIKEFQKQYSLYAPAGANLKRIERGISVSEQEFLELIHGLNLAKLKMQDIELSSNIKAVDHPFFPIEPNPTKRNMLVMVAGVVGFILVLTMILITEYFDDTLRNQDKTGKILQLNAAGIFPKILLNSGGMNFPFIANRLIELVVQDMKLAMSEKDKDHSPRTIIFFSMLPREGKSVLANNIGYKLKQLGNKVLLLSYSPESLKESETLRLGYPASGSKKGKGQKAIKFGWLSRLLGYPDTRIDHDSPFLEPTELFFSTGEYGYYLFNEDYFTSKSCLDLAAKNGIEIIESLDYILLEIPALLYYPYPSDLVASADFSILIARSNRVWSKADQKSLDIILKQTARPPHFLLNGVNLQVCESLIGELPKKRSRLRRIFKKLVHLQFYDRYQT